MERGNGHYILFSLAVDKVFCNVAQQTRAAKQKTSQPIKEAPPVPNGARHQCLPGASRHISVVWPSQTGLPLGANPWLPHKHTQTNGNT